jgi:hypothetical protein
MTDVQVDASDDRDPLSLAAEQLNHALAIVRVRSATPFVDPSLVDVQKYLEAALAAVWSGVDAKLRLFANLVNALETAAAAIAELDEYLFS